MSAPLRPGTAIAVAVALFACALVPGGFAAAACALLVSTATPRLCPVLLIALASIQDAPGLAAPLVYPTIAAVCAAWAAHAVGRRASMPSLAALVRRPLLAGAIAALCYGLLLSCLYDATQARPQSPLRPYPALWAMSLMMAGAGVACGERLGGADRRALAATALATLAHMVVIAGLQVAIGHEFYRSAAGLDIIEGESQLTDASTAGFARICGSFLSPNTLSYVTALLLIALLAGRDPRRMRRRSIAMFAIVGAVIGVLSMSRSMIAFFILSTIALIGMRSLLAAAIAAGAVTAGVAIAAASGAMDTVVDAMRFASGDVGQRGVMWAAAVEHLAASDWLFGTGLSYWPTFFARYAGQPAADPHTYLLSLPGTYGVIGVAYYAVLACALARLACDPSLRAAAMLLAILLFVSDLGSPPYLLGNNQITLLIWTVLGCIAPASAPRVRPLSWLPRPCSAVTC